MEVFIPFGYLLLEFGVIAFIVQRQLATKRVKSVLGEVTAREGKAMVE